MVGSCSCLKENLDELRIERVCYERVTGYPEVIPGQKSASGRLRPSIPMRDQSLRVRLGGQYRTGYAHLFHAQLCLWATPTIQLLSFRASHFESRSRQVWKLVAYASA